MIWDEEPALGESKGVQSAANEQAHSLAQEIKELLGQELYAVLCTQGEGQPYGSVVAFAASGDLRLLLFATPTTTRKYRLLRECPRVALVIDSRSRFPNDLTQVAAVTVTGRATEVAKGPEFERLAESLLSRHPHLRAFVAAPSTALFRVDVVRYLHVVRFQEVRQWVPGQSS